MQIILHITGTEPLEGSSTGPAGVPRPFRGLMEMTGVLLDEVQRAYPPHDAPDSGLPATAPPDRV